MGRRIALAGLAGLLAAPAFLIESASAAILFTCDSVDGSGTLSPGLVRDRRAESLSSGPTAPAGPAELTLASTSDAGVKGNDDSTMAGLLMASLTALSADGSRVAFWSSATNLDSADTHSVFDVYVKDLTTGNIALASTSDAGVKSNDVSAGSSLSQDGTRVAFDSSATNLDPGDTDTATDSYVKDLTTGDITLASTSDTGVNGSGESFGVALSADGMHVAFTSTATNLDPGDTDSLGDIYVKDLTTGDIVLASTSDTGVKGNFRSSVPSLSQDGTRVAFHSEARNLDPGDPDSTDDIYVKDLTTGDIVLASTSDSGVKANRGGVDPVLSADGTRVVFETAAFNLDHADPDQQFDNTDSYVKDLTTGDIVLASTSDAGVVGDDDSFSPAIAADGTKVTFRSFATNFDLAHTDFGADVYVKDLTTGDLTLASASDTGVSANDDVYPPSLSADGSRVAFSSDATNLDPADTDSVFDVYVKDLPAVPTSIDISDCSNGQSGAASVVDLRSYGARPLGCPVALGGAAGNDYPDQTPVLLGSNPSLRIDWASGPDSVGVAKLKMGTSGTQWRAVLAIQASPGHSTPATNQYLPASGSGFTKTKLKGRVDWSALDSFNCTTGTADPLSWLDLVNNGGFIVKNA